MTMTHQKFTSAQKRLKQSTNIFSIDYFYKNHGDFFAAAVFLTLIAHFFFKFSFTQQLLYFNYKVNFKDKKFLKSQGIFSPRKLHQIENYNYYQSGFKDFYQILFLVCVCFTITSFLHEIIFTQIVKNVKICAPATGKKVKKTLLSLFWYVFATLMAFLAIRSESISVEEAGRIYPSFRTVFGIFKFHEASASSEGPSEGPTEGPSEAHHFYTVKTYPHNHLTNTWVKTFIITSSSYWLASIPEIHLKNFFTTQNAKSAHIKLGFLQFILLLSSYYTNLWKVALILSFLDNFSKFVFYLARCAKYFGFCELSNGVFLLWELLAVVCPAISMWFLVKYFQIYDWVEEFLDQNSSYEKATQNGQAAQNAQNDNTWPEQYSSLQFLAFLISFSTCLYNLKAFYDCYVRHYQLMQQLANLKKKQHDGKKVMKARKIVGSCLHMHGDRRGSSFSRGR